jgi:hypothetical protein
MRRILLASALLAAAVAQTKALECNENGAVVTLESGDVLYLGKDCDAARKGGGTGTWWNTASFLGVEIDGKAYMVTVEIDCLPFCSTS